SAEQLWKEAFAAHSNRRYEEAARLYEETARAAFATRPALAEHASAQARALRAWLDSNNKASVFTASGGERPSAQLGSPSSGTGTGTGTGTPERTAPVGSYRGRLRTAGWSIDGRPGYYLDIDVPGQLRQPGFYVSAGPNINLPAWAGKDVEV